MPLDDSEIMQKARQARDRLVAKYINDPDVVLIDIGFPPNAVTDTQNYEIVIRIHVRENWFKSKPEKRIKFPEEIDGIRVFVIPGDYHLE